MDTQKVETRALSGDQLDAVSGGMFAMGLSNMIAQATQAMIDGQRGGGGDQKDPLAQMFQQLLQQ